MVVCGVVYMDATRTLPHQHYGITAHTHTPYAIPHYCTCTCRMRDFKRALVVCECVCVCALSRSAVVGNAVSCYPHHANRGRGNLAVTIFTRYSVAYRDKM